MDVNDEVNIRSVLKQRIADARIRKGLGQAELTKLVTGSNRAATSSDWETGKRVPDAVTLAKIASALGVTVGYLLGQDEVGGTEKPAPIVRERVNTEPIGDAERLDLLRMLAGVQAAVAQGQAPSAPTKAEEEEQLRNLRDGGAIAPVEDEGRRNHGAG